MPLLDGDSEVTYVLAAVNKVKSPRMFNGEDSLFLTIVSKVCRKVIERFKEQSEENLAFAIINVSNDLLAPFSLRDFLLQF